MIICLVFLFFSIASKIVMVVFCYLVFNFGKQFVIISSMLNY